MRFKYLYTRVSIVIRASYIYIYIYIYVTYIFFFSLPLSLFDRVLLIFVSYDNICDIYIPAIPKTKNVNNHILQFINQQRNIV